MNFAAASGTPCAITVSAASAATYGDGALMHGMNVSFLWMTVGALVLLAISLFAVKAGGRRQNP